MTISLSKSISIALTLSIAYNVFMTPAFAGQQSSARKGESNVVDHRTKKVRDHRSDKVVDSDKRIIRDHRDDGVSANPLTAQECGLLGGELVSLSYCQTGGKACQTKDQAGKLHHVCVKIYSSSNTSSDTNQTSARGSFDATRAPAGKVQAISLTSQECTGLGGTVGNTNKCSQSDMEACTTVDNHGVIRTACINTVVD